LRRLEGQEEKHQDLIHPRLFYALVDLEPDIPVVYVVPSAVVADVLTRSHRTWLGMPGVHGQPHQDNPMRRLLAEFPFPVPGAAPGWLAEYRERWEYLTADAASTQWPSGVAPPTVDAGLPREADRARPTRRLDRAEGPAAARGPEPLLRHRYAAFVRPTLPLPK